MEPYAHLDFQFPAVNNVGKQFVHVACMMQTYVRLEEVVQVGFEITLSDGSKRKEIGNLIAIP